MLYLSNLRPAFDQSIFLSLPEAERERIAFDLLSLTNYVPEACAARPDLISTMADPDDPDWLILDIDELPRPCELR